MGDRPRPVFSNKTYMNYNELNFQIQPQKPTKLEIKTLKYILKFFGGKCEQFYKIPIDQISENIGTDRFYVCRLIKRLERRGAVTRKGHKLCVHLNPARQTITASSKSCNFELVFTSKLQLSNENAIININHVNKYTNHVFSYKQNQSCSQKNQKSGPSGPIDFKFYLKKHWDTCLKYISVVTDTSKIKDLDAYNASVLRNWYKSKWVNFRPIGQIRPIVFFVLTHFICAWV